MSTRHASLSADRIQLAASYVPKWVIATFQHDTEPLESNVTERIPGVLLHIALTELSSSQISLLNKLWLDPIATIAAKYGGDIVHFACDSVTVLWHWSDTASHTELRMAALCAQKISSRVCHKDAGNALEEAQCSCILKMGIAASEDVFIATIGGFQGTWRFLVAGNAIKDAKKAAREVERHGGIVVPQETWQYMHEFCSGTVLRSGRIAFSKVDRGFTAPRNISDLIPELPLENHGLVSLLAGHMPLPVKSLLEDNQLLLWLSVDKSAVRFVTVLMVHLPDFNMDWDTESLLQKVFLTFQTVVNHYHGYDFQNIVSDRGITIAGIFGAPPLVYEGHASRATLAAIELQQRLKSLNVTFTLSVSSGSTDYGTIGNRERRAYAFGGKVLSTCYRVAQCVPPLSIVCDSGCRTFLESTPHRLGDQVVLELLAPIKYLETMTLYVPSLVQQATHDATKRNPYVARKQELAFLLNKIMDPSSKNNHFLVEGDSGSGKTFLVQELGRRAQSLGFKVTSASCVPYEKDTPFFTAKVSFRAGLEDGAIYPGDKPEVSSVEEQFDLCGLSKENRALVMNVLYGTHIEGVGKINLENKLHMTREALHIIHDNIRHPFLAIYEDTQWMDEHTLQGFQRSLEVRNPNIFIVLTSRGNEVPTLFRDHFEKHPENRFKLGPLDEKAIRYVVCDHFRVRSLPKDLEPILSNSEGNPFHAIDLAQKLASEGLIRMNSRQCMAKALKCNSFNRTLFCEVAKESAVTVFDNMPPSLQSILEVASVLEIFNESSIRALCPSLGQFMGLQVEDLQERNIIENVVEENNSNSGMFVFCNVLWKEMVYSMMPSCRRETLHFLAAKWYEATFHENLSPYYNRIAMHYSKAGIDRRPQHKSVAIFYLEKASDQALQRFAFSEAVFFLTTLINLKKGTALSEEDFLKFARWEQDLGKVHAALGEYKLAIKYLEQALTILGQPLPSNSKGMNTFRIMMDVAFIKVKKSAEGNMQKLKQCIFCYEMLAECYYFEHDLLRATYCTVQIGKLVEKVGISGEMASFYANLAVLSSVWQLHSISERCFRTSQEVLGQVEDAAGIAHVSVRLALFKTSTGEMQTAINMCNRCIEAADIAGDRYNKAAAQGLLGFCELMFGRIEKCMQLFRESIEVTTSDLGVSLGKMLIVSCLMRLFRVKEAAMVLEEVDYSSDVSTGFVTTACLSSEALILTANGNKEKGILIAERVLGLINERIPHSPLTMITHENLSFLFCKLLLDGDGDEKIKLLYRKSIIAFKNFVKVHPIGKASYLLQYGRFEKMQNNHKQALAAFQGALNWLNEKKLVLPYYQGHIMLEIFKYTHDSDMNSQGCKLLDAIGVSMPVSSISFVSERRVSVALDEDFCRDFRSESREDPLGAWPSIT